MKNQGKDISLKDRTLTDHVIQCIVTYTYIHENQPVKETCRYLEHIWIKRKRMEKCKTTRQKEELQALIPQETMRARATLRLCVMLANA